MPSIDPEAAATSEPDRIDEVAVCRTLLRIVARLEESAYTDDQLRQTAELEPDDLADPASEANTSQG